MFTFAGVFMWCKYISSVGVAGVANLPHELLMLLAELGCGLVSEVYFVYLWCAGGPSDIVQMVSGNGF